MIVEYENKPNFKIYGVFVLSTSTLITKITNE